MNRIYKTIWNAATQSWTVAGELASAKSKSASKTVSTLTALSVVSVLGVSSAMAASTEIETAGTNNVNNIVTKLGKTVIIINNGGNVKTESDTAKPNNIIVIGSQKSQVYDDQILIGYGFNSPGKPYAENGKSAGKAGDVAIGNRITLGGSDSSGPEAKDSFSTVVGYGAQAVGPVVAMGVGARSDMRSYGGWESVKAGVVAVGPFALAADNKNSTTAVGALSAANYENSVAIGALSGAAHNWEDRGFGEQFTKKDSDKVMYQILEAGGSVATRDNLTSVGYKAAARGPEATAIGTGALTGTAGKRSGEKAIAVGAGAHAITDNTIAIGDNAHAGGLTSTQKTELEKEIKRLEGLQTTATENLTKARTMLGENGTAENKFRVASANAALERINLALERAKQDKSRNNAHKDSNAQFAMAIGAGSLANNAKATAIGRFANARGENSNAIGYEAKVWGNNSNVLGANSKIEGDKENSTAIGSNNTVNSANVMVLGNNVIINNKGKIRDGAVVLGDKSDGLLEKNPVKAVNSATVGNTTYSGFAGNLDNKGSETTEPNDKQGRFVSIGNAGNERQIKHVAAGWIHANSTDAINGSQLYGMTSVLDTRVSANEGKIAAIEGNITTIQGDINDIKNNVTTQGDKLGELEKSITNITNNGLTNWTIKAGDNKSSDINVSKSKPEVTFKGEKGVNVALNPETNTVTISGGLSDDDKNGIKNDIKNEIAGDISSILDNADAGFSIKQNGKIP